MTILGIDPGTATTGWGVVEKYEDNRVTYVASGVILTEKGDEAGRLLTIATDLKTLLATYKPHVAAVERLFFNTNAKTALKVGQARGVILLELVRYNLQIYSYTPLQVKMAVAGYGRADKRQVQEMVKRILELKVVPKPDDAADALAVALTQCVSQKFDKE